MSVHFAVVGRDAAETNQLLAVLPEGEPVRVLQSPSWVPGAQAAAVGHAVLPLIEDDSVVIVGSGQDGRDLAGWLAVKLDAPVIWAAESVRAEDKGLEVVRTAHGGRLRVMHHVDAGPSVVLAKPTRNTRESGATAHKVMTFGVAETGPVVSMSTPPKSDGHSAPLATAQIVVSVGRGIGGPDNLDLFRELANRLNGALGASRVVVDSGWLPFAHQVGQTGASVAPTVYLAFGVSGAVQHQAGMRNSKVVIAVNTDREAPLCRAADLVVEGDAVKVASALMDRIRQLATGPATADRTRERTVP